MNVFVTLPRAKTVSVVTGSTVLIENVLKPAGEGAATPVGVCVSRLVERPLPAFSFEKQPVKNSTNMVVRTAAAIPCVDRRLRPTDSKHDVALLGAFSRHARRARVDRWKSYVGALNNPPTRIADRRELTTA
jgi:hypothetical protein